MGRANRQAEDLFYSESFGPIIDPLDSKSPSDGTMDYVDELLDDARDGRMDSALYAMQMIDFKGSVSDYPALQKLMVGLLGDQVRVSLRKQKLKLKEKGAKAEQGEIIASLLENVAKRFWAKPQVDPETGEEIPLPSLEDRIAVDNSDIALAAMQSDADPSPIGDQFRDRIASSGLFSLNQDFLAAALSPDASDKTKSAVEESLHREVVKDAEAWAQRFSVEPTVDNGYWTSYGVSRTTSNGPSILHLRKEDRRMESLCGKGISRSAAYGSWKDASSGAQHRRCQQCEKAASAKLLKEVESQSAASASNYFPKSVAGKVDDISKSPEVQKAISDWTSSPDKDVSELKSKIKECVASKMRPILVDVVESPDVSSDYGHPLATMLPSSVRRKLQAADLWDYSDKDKTKKMIVDVFPEEARAKLVEMIFDKGINGRYYMGTDGTPEITEYLEPFVDDYISKNVPEAQE